MAQRQRGPAFVQYFVPVLQALHEVGGAARPAEVRDAVVKKLAISEIQQAELLKSGGVRFDNQIAWARFYLSKADLVDPSERGIWRLTPTGLAALPAFDAAAALAIFGQVQAQFRAARVAGGREDDTPAPSEAMVATDALDYRMQFLQAVRRLPPVQFERFCQRLLRECGFEQVSITGRSGDQGIDGIGVLQINRLMSTRMLFQCKRYVSNVTPSEIRDFRGAMSGRTESGIVITTGGFSAEARREAVREGVTPIELVDAERLVDLCAQFGLGLRPVQTYEFDGTFFTGFVGD